MLESHFEFMNCLPWFAHVAQLVERVLGKDEVSSSILDVGSPKHPDHRHRTVAVSIAMPATE